MRAASASNAAVERRAPTSRRSARWPRTWPATADTALIGSTTYSYRVRAVNSGGTSAYSNISESTTPPAVPAAPSSLTATAVSSTQINLAWVDTATDETGFSIERCQGSGCTSFVQIAQVAANVNGYSDGGLQPGTAYTYRVRAFNGSGNSSYSGTATASTPTPTTPAAPTNLSGTAPTARRIDLRWNDNSADETGFRIEQSIDGTTFVEIATVASGVTPSTETTA